MDKRARIIAAAFEVLAEQGSESASIKEIARAAAVAPGLVHYYFASKDDLLVAVVREVSRQFGATIRAVRDSTAPELLPGSALAAIRDRVREVPGQYRTRFDLYALGLHNAALQPAVATLIADIRQGIATSVRRFLGDDPDADILAAVLFAAFEGLALQYLFDPSLDLDRAFALLERMIVSLQSPAP